jgi:hypothetical protein
MRGQLAKMVSSKGLRYKKQIKTPHLFRLLSLEMLHRRVEIEKQEVVNTTTLSIMSRQR